MGERILGRAVAPFREVVDNSLRNPGLSNADEGTVRRAHAVHPVSVLQSGCSIFARGVETLFPVLDELDIGFVAYSPLTRGFLSGAVRPRREYSPDGLPAAHPVVGAGEFRG